MNSRDLVKRHEDSIHAGVTLAPLNNDNTAISWNKPIQSNRAHDAQTTSSRPAESGTSITTGRNSSKGQNVHIPGPQIHPQKRRKAKAATATNFQDPTNQVGELNTRSTRRSLELPIGYDEPEAGPLLVAQNNYLNSNVRLQDNPNEDYSCTNTLSLEPIPGIAQSHEANGLNNLEDLGGDTSGLMQPPNIDRSLDLSALGNGFDPLSFLSNEALTPLYAPMSLPRNDLQSKSCPAGSGGTCMTFLQDSNTSLLTHYMDYDLFSLPFLESEPIFQFPLSQQHQREGQQGHKIDRPQHFKYQSQDQQQQQHQQHQQHHQEQEEKQQAEQRHYNDKIQERDQEQQQRGEVSQQQEYCHQDEHDQAQPNTYTLLKNLPIVQREKQTNTCKFDLNEADYKSILKDAADRLRLPTVTQYVPNAKELHRFLNTYVENFHRHLPLIHLPSFSPADTPSPLIFAICSIGALFRLDRRRAIRLFKMADYALKLDAFGLQETTFTDTVEPSNASHNDSKALAGPLWTAQARVLLCYYAIFSGDKTIVASALQNLGVLCLDYKFRRASLMEKNLQVRKQIAWDEWVVRESSKRLLGSVFIISNLIVLTYDGTPTLDITDDLQIEAPSDEKLWAAASMENWSEILQSRPAPRIMTIRQMLTDLISGNELPNASQVGQYQIPAFTALVMMHAINIHVWHIMQFVRTRNLTLGGNEMNKSLSESLLSTAHSTVYRCSEAIARGRGNDYEATWDDPDGPLTFNCQAILRIAISHIFVDKVGSLDRLVLISDDEEQVSSAIVACLATKQERGSNINKAVSRAYEGFAMPIRIGPLLVSKTAALNWSVEHAIAGWDSGTGLRSFLQVVILTHTSSATPYAMDLCCRNDKSSIASNTRRDSNSGSIKGLVGRSRERLRWHGIARCSSLKSLGRFPERCKLLIQRLCHFVSDVSRQYVTLSYLCSELMQALGLGLGNHSTHGLYLAEAGKSIRSGLSYLYTAVNEHLPPSKLRCRTLVPMPSRS